MRGVTILVLIAVFLVGCRDRTPETKDAGAKSSSTPSTGMDRPSQDTPATAESVAKPPAAESIQTASSEEPSDSPEPQQSEAELWDCYRKARARAQEHEDRDEFERSIEELLRAAHCALQLDRPDIAAWQYNNAAKQGIDSFMSKTSYRERIARIGRMDHGGEKDSYVEECRMSFRERWPILERARMHLDKALELNEKDQDPQRRSVIRSNRAFVAEVEALIS